MNICYISNSRVPSRNANSIHVMKMCQAYASLGHQVTLVVPDWDETKIEKGIDDYHAFYGVQSNFAIRKVPLLFWSRLDVLYFGVVMPLMALRRQPALVHSRGLTAAWGMTNLFRMPTIFETHQPPSKNPRRRALFNRTIKSPHLRALVLITRALAEHVQPMLPRATQLLVAPDGVGSDWLHNSTSILEARRELGLEHEERRIAVYTGQLYTGRGVELIINLAQSMPNHMFLVVGGRDEDVARNRREAEHLPNLRFEGFKPPARMFLYLKAADVLLMPYANRVETSGGGNTAAFASPLKMFEYMAAGRPILASTLPVLQEVLQHEVNSLLLPYENPEMWRDALRRLENDSAFGDALARRAREDVEQYTWENRARLLLEKSGCEARV